VVVLERKNFASPDEARDFVAKGRTEVLRLSMGSVRRLTYEPGWRWSTHVGPLAGRSTCGLAHFGVVLSGSQAVRLDDGTELVLRAGDVFTIPAGHDGWTIGDEPCVVLDFAGGDPFSSADAAARPSS
jgi:quercetin dioxygenase-like cupin family protein